MEKTDIKNRGFYWSNKAIYKDVIKQPEIMFGLYSKSGGTYGEMSVRWHNLMGKSSPRLEIYGDAIKAFASFPDLLAEMTKLGDEFTQEEFVAVLKKCHFKDKTEYSK